MKSSTNDTAKLAAAVSLQRLVEAKAVKLRARKDGTLTGTCPFHAGSRSKTRPVLTVDTKANTWACPACRMKSGTVIDWTIKTEGVSRKHAIELLRQDHGVGSGSKRTAKSAAKLEAFASTGEPDHVVMSRVLDYYAETLKQSPEALAYLRDRKLIHGELLDAFKLGYCNRTLGYRIGPKNRKYGFLLRTQLERLGIQRSSGHEHFNGAITFPVLDEQGQVVQIYGRKILGDSRLKKGTPLHLWLPGGVRGVFNPHAFNASNEIVITKGIVDALTLWCHGVRNVTATFNGFELHGDLRAAITAVNIKRLLIAFDRTREGDAAADKIAAEVGEVGIEVFRVQLPNGLDVNDYARSVEQPAYALQQAVRSAVWLGGKARPATVVQQHSETRAVPAPTTPSPEVASVEQREDEVVLHFGDRRWRLRGLRRNTSYETMRVNLLVGRDNGHPLGHGFHADVLELYSARQRAAFVTQASEELGIDEQVIKHDLGRVLLELERLQDAQIREALEPKDKPVEMTEEEREAALGLLRDPRLIERITADFEHVGFVGEHTNKLVAYLAATSRKLDEPLAVLVQSSSAAGKTTLMDAVLSFIPEEDNAAFSAMTGQSLYYMGERDLAHRVLAIAEEAGARKSSYALKLLQSEGEISIASTAKDAGTGRLVTQEYRVQGPVMLFMTTTSLDVDPELANRCVVLSVDEGREQTAAIQRLQRHRQTLQGVLEGRERDAVTKLHRNAQRLLRPITIVNPFAAELSFHDGSPRSRRDNAKFLTLIKTVTLLHQYQRQVKTVEHLGHRVEYIEVAEADLELATKLAAEVLLHQDGEELPPQTAKLLGSIRVFIAELATKQDIEPAKVRFTRRELRERVGLSNSTVRVHLVRLVDLEYVVEERGPRRLRRYGIDGDLAGPETTWRAHGGGGGRQVVANDPESLSSLGGVAATARPGNPRKSASYSQTRPSK
jgi:DNA primase